MRNRLIRLWSMASQNFAGWASRLETQDSRCAAVLVCMSGGGRPRSTGVPAWGWRLTSTTRKSWSYSQVHRQPETSLWLWRSQPFQAIQAFSWLDETHIHCEDLNVNLSQKHPPSNIQNDILLNVWALCSLRSWHIKLTIIVILKQIEKVVCSPSP